MKHILDRVKQDLTRGRLLDLPGGIVLVGGTAIMPGVVEVAQEFLRQMLNFTCQIKLVSVIQCLQM